MYRQLLPAAETPKPVAEFFEDVVDPYLADVHAMIRLPLFESGVTAGCNYSAAQTLLAVLAGASVTLYDPITKGERGRLFRGFVRDFYPWDTEPPAGVSDPDEGASLLYDAFRNPLVLNRTGFPGGPIH